MERYCLFPLEHPDIFDFYEKHVASFWTVHEVDLSYDADDFEEKLNDDERHFLLHILAFFASSDSIVNENLAARFLSDTDIPEVKQFYAFQIGMEAIHTHMYHLLIDAYVKDRAQKLELHRSVLHHDGIQGKAEWALRWLDSDRDYAERLVAFACVEGILFSASFCAIFYFKKRGLMPGLCFSNELISRDEGLHRDFACHIYSRIVSPTGRLDEAVVHKIVRSAVDAEIDFVKKALPVSIIGLSSESMTQYVYYVADHLLASLGHGLMYNVTNPYEFMTLLSVEGKTNFFEKRVGEYRRANSARKSDEDTQFALDAVF